MPPADEGAGSAGQTQRARTVLPLRCRAHRASVRQASPHGHRRLAGSSAESQRGGPVTHHLFWEGAPRADQEPPRGQRPPWNCKHTCKRGKFIRNMPLSELLLLCHPSPVLTDFQDLPVSQWHRRSYGRPRRILSCVLGCWSLLHLPFFFSFPCHSSAVLLLFVYLSPPHSSSSSRAWLTPSWPDFVHTGTSSDQLQLRKKTSCSETEVWPRCFHTGQWWKSQQWRQKFSGWCFGPRDVNPPPPLSWISNRWTNDENNN